MKTRTTPASRTVTGKLLTFAALGAYFAVLFVGGLIVGDKMPVIAPNFIIYLNPLTYAIAWLVTAGVLLAYGSISKAVVYKFTWVAALAFAIRNTVSGGSYFLAFAMCALAIGMTAACGWALRTEPAGKKKEFTLSPAGSKITLGVIAVLMGGWALFLLLSAYLRYATSPSTSTALYIQLMESLRSGFSFDTTLEFGESVSHLAAHISPIFLAYLPFYAIIPSPVTLMILQVAAVCSAVIPLWMIARKKGLSPALSLLVCGLLCTFPAVWCGAAGSLHEYALLLPLLLWLLWALESNRKILPWVFVGLILCVRETCAIHLFAVGLYHLINNRKARETDHSLKDSRRRGLWIMGISLVYFILAMALLTYLGKGTLITRFENVTGIYATDFGTLIRELIFNPAIALYEMLTEAKLHYLLCLLLPLGLLPLFSRKKAGLVFLLPLLLLNLLSDFPYHYNPDYPYSFGVAALGLYLTVEALATLSAIPEKSLLVKRLATAAVCCTLIIGGLRMAEYTPFLTDTQNSQKEAAAITQMLDSIEDDASVSASGYLLPSLAARSGIYTLSHKAETDYVVLDLRDEWTVSHEKTYTVEYYEKLGYAVVEKADGICAVLKKQ
jgi:uncharacterized membrane protein